MFFSFVIFVGSTTSQVFLQHSLFFSGPLFLLCLFNVVPSHYSILVLIGTSGPIYGILRCHATLLISIITQFSCILPLVSIASSCVFLSMMFSYDERIYLAISLFFSTVYQLCEDATQHRNSIPNVMAKNGSTFVHKVSVIGSLFSFISTLALWIGVMVDAIPNMKRCDVIKTADATFTAGSLILSALVIVLIALYKRLYFSWFRSRCSLYSTVPLMRTTQNLYDLDLTRGGRVTTASSPGNGNVFREFCRHT